MSRVPRNLLFAVLACTTVSVSPAIAAPNGDCRQRSLSELKSTTQEGYAIYEAIAHSGSVSIRERETWDAPTHRPVPNERWSLRKTLLAKDLSASHFTLCFCNVYVSVM